MPLEDYYGGDVGFHELAEACALEWPKCACKVELLDAVGGDLDLAIVFHYHFGDKVFEGLNKQTPALEGLTPAECIKSEKGRRRLKECLWRMP
jgi:hypothetical protein